MINERLAHGIREALKEIDIKFHYYIGYPIKEAYESLKQKSWKEKAGITAGTGLAFLVAREFTKPQAAYTEEAKAEEAEASVPEKSLDERIREFEAKVRENPSAENYAFLGYLYEGKRDEKKSKNMYEKAFGINGLVSTEENPLYIDDIYKRAIAADYIYPGGRIIRSHTKIMSKKVSLRFREGEWIKYYFDSGQLSEDLQNILRKDDKINFEYFHKFMVQYKHRFIGVVLSRDGYATFGIKGKDCPDIILPINEKSVDLIDKL